MNKLLARPILVIEDTELNLQLMLNILEKRGFSNVTCARDGVAALERMEQNGLPDLIILDMMMPRMDGSTLCKYLRTMESCQRMPILVLASTPQEYQKLALLGATDMIAKPIMPHQLLEKVIKHLKEAPPMHAIPVNSPTLYLER